MSILDGKLFQNFALNLFKELKENEELVINYSAEETHFTRMSQAKVRQATELIQGFLSFKYIRENKVISFSIPYLGTDDDLVNSVKELNQKRQWILGLPDDPYLVKPTNNGNSFNEMNSQMPKASEMLNDILLNSQGVDLAGVFSTGEVVRATINSKDQFHWFKTKNFCLDYSLYNEKQKAVKSLYAGREWDKNVLVENLKNSKLQLEILGREQKNIERGEYRVYLAPSAVNELLGTLSWSGVSMSAHKQGNASLLDLWKGKKNFSPLFSLSEDFSIGLAPRFNDNGEVAPLKLDLVTNGEFRNFLTATRTANEFGVESNFASDWESLRSPKINVGELAQKDVLKELGTGLYISDLHYINWSDRSSARITGMTRYACFWVENGEIKAPINDLRFDESYYNIFGDKLLGITNFSNIVPSTGTYEQREIGGVEVPGLLLSGFKFTL